MRQVAAVLLCTLALLITPVRGKPRVTSTETNWSLSVTTVPSPAAPNSGQPQLSTLADRAGLSWVERTGENANLRFSDRTDSGWTEPRTVASGANWFVNWADVPSIIPLQHESMAAHWL